MLLIKIEELREFILPEEKNKGAVKKEESARKSTLCITKWCYKNAIKLYNKRSDIYNAIVNKNIYSGDV